MIEKRPDTTDAEPVFAVHDAQFDRHGIAEQKELYDRPRDGFVAPDGFYGYETHAEGFQSVSESPSDDPEAQLRELIAGIDRWEISREEISVSADVQDRLEDLGYA